MNRWIGKVAIVTGASAGIGAAIVLDLAKAGVITIGLARRSERVEGLKKQLPENARKNVIAHKCDVSSEQEIKDAFAWVEKHYGGVDVLINNAGIFRTTRILKEDNSNDITDVVNTNLLGPVFCIREAFRSMKIRDTPGHIITINSVAGHNVVSFANLPEGFGSLNIYPSTKYGVTALTEVVRQELLMKKTKIKITSISPGVVKTEIIPESVDTSNVPFLLSEDISAAVLYVLGTPERVQVHELIIKPVVLVNNKN